MSLHRCFQAGEEEYFLLGGKAGDGGVHGLGGMRIALPGMRITLKVGSGSGAIHRRTSIKHFINMLFHHAWRQPLFAAATQEGSLHPHSMALYSARHICFGLQVAPEGLLCECTQP